MKKIFVLLLSIAVIIYGCGSSQDNNTANADSLKTAGDTVLAKAFPLSNNFSEVEKTFQPQTKFPYVIDSVYFAGLEKNTAQQLSGEIVIQLTKNFHSLESFTSGQYTIESFLQLDTLKVNGKYEDFLSKADIGMTTKSEAYPYHVLTLNNDIKAYIWYIKHSTYEACPFGQGTEIFMTFIKENKVLCCAQIAEESGGADAPYWGEDKYHTQITPAGEFTIKHVSRQGGDTDEKGNDIVEEKKEEFKFTWNNCVWTKL